MHARSCVIVWSCVGGFGSPLAPLAVRGRVSLGLLCFCELLAALPSPSRTLDPREELPHERAHGRLHLGKRSSQRPKGAASAASAAAGVCTGWGRRVDAGGALRVSTEPNGGLAVSRSGWGHSSHRAKTEAWAARHVRGRDGKGGNQNAS